MSNNLADGIKFFPAAAIGIGFILIAAFALRHLPENTRAMMLHIQHPETFRFTKYDDLLKKYVKNGRVDYANFKQDPEMREALSVLEKTAPDQLKDEKERASYWINAFNLLTIKLICDHYPITSTDEVREFWSQTPFIVGGQTSSVSRVYDRAMSEIKDRRLPPATVFLLCRGSLGYPPLTDHAISPETIEMDAKLAAYKFANDKRNVFYDDEHLNFLLSPLFKRYERILNRAKFDPHTYAAMLMTENRAPDLTNIMITKTYYAKIDPTLNDTALAPTKESE